MNWRSKYKQETRTLVKETFNKYKVALSTIKQFRESGVSQKVTVSYDKEPVKGGYGKSSFENSVDKCQDAIIYRDKIDDILKLLPGMYKKIIIEAFIREASDIATYVDLGLPRSSYYFMKNEAIKMFVDELLTREIQI